MVAVAVRVGVRVIVGTSVKVEVSVGWSVKLGNAVIVSTAEVSTRFTVGDGFGAWQAVMSRTETDNSEIKVVILLGIIIVFLDCYD